MTVNRTWTVSLCTNFLILCTYPRLKLAWIAGTQQDSILSILAYAHSSFAVIPYSRDSTEFAPHCTEATTMEVTAVLSEQREIPKMPHVPSMRSIQLFKDLGKTVKSDCSNRPFPLVSAHDTNASAQLGHAGRNLHSTRHGYDDDSARIWKIL